MNFFLGGGNLTMTRTNLKEKTDIKNNNLNAKVLTKAKSKEELDKMLLPEVLKEQEVIGNQQDEVMEKVQNQEEQELAKREEMENKTKVEERGKV